MVGPSADVADGPPLRPLRPPRPPRPAAAPARRCCRSAPVPAGASAPRRARCRRADGAWGSGAGRLVGPARVTACRGVAAVGVTSAVHHGAVLDLPTTAEVPCRAPRSGCCRGGGPGTRRPLGDLAEGRPVGLRAPTSTAGVVHGTAHSALRARQRLHQAWLCCCPQSYPRSVPGYAQVLRLTLRKHRPAG